MRSHATDYSRTLSRDKTLRWSVLCNYLGDLDKIIGKNETLKITKKGAMELKRTDAMN